MYLKKLSLLVTLAATLSGTATQSHAGLFGCCFGESKDEDDLSRPINASASTPLLQSQENRTLAVPDTRYIRTMSLAEQTHVGTLVTKLNSAAEKGEIVLSKYGSNSLMLDLRNKEGIESPNDAVVIIQGLGLAEMQSGGVTPIAIQLFSGGRLEENLTPAQTREKLAGNPIKMLNSDALKRIRASVHGDNLKDEFERTFGQLLTLEGRMYAISSDGVRAVRFEIINWGCIDFCSGLRTQADIAAILSTTGKRAVAQSPEIIE